MELNFSTVNMVGILCFLEMVLQMEVAGVMSENEEKIDAVVDRP